MKTEENKYNATEIIIREGIQIDIEEGWKKIISRQFGGDPGRGFGELIQNFLDSYNSDVEWENRKGVITSGKDWLSLKDFGSGLDLNKIKLVTTLGGTDKSNDSKKIGKFGIGFFSIFNPKLGTRKVIITTLCEGFPLEVQIIVNKNGELPVLEYKFLEDNIDFSTEVKVFFDNDQSVKKCISYAEQSLKYYPCDVTINGTRHYSIWNNAQNQNALFFTKKYCNGFINSLSSYQEVTLLCKYEYLANLSLPCLVTGGRNMKYDLRDYASHKTPYLPGIGITVNCNNLSVTISRDSWYLDYHFNNFIKELNEVLFELIDNQFDSLTEQVILANMFIFRNEIKQFIHSFNPKKVEENNSINVIEKLTNAKIFSINGKKEKFSLLDLYHRKSEELPLYFTENNRNLRWLGGSFKHDFIVITKSSFNGNGTPSFYSILFQHIFNDVVNLSTIENDKKKINELIDKEIINKESLEPKCDFVKIYSLSNNEKEFINKVKNLLNNKKVIDAIERSIQLPIKQIKPVFFRLENKGLYISTGLFDDNKKPINDDFISNFLSKKDEQDIDKMLEKENTILLGLCLDHPFIKKLIESEEPQSEFYALTYIAHELTSCQKVLSPYSTFYNMVKSKLTTNLRKCMIDVIAEQSGHVLEA